MIVLEILTTNYSKIELVDGVFYLKLKDGTRMNIFLYKYKRVENIENPENIFNTSFDYDMVILDNDNNAYMYFTYNYLDEPQEVF